MNELEIYRKKIDALDDTLLDVLFERQSIVKKVGEYKHAHNLPVADAARKAAVMKKFKTAPGLDGKFGEELYELIHKYAVKSEEEIK